MHWLRGIGSFSAVALALSLVSCDQAKEAANPTKATPDASQSAEAKSPGVSAPLGTKRSVWPPQAGPAYNPPVRAEAVAKTQRGRFQQEISTSAPLKTIRANDTVTIPVVVKNLSQETWSATGNAGSLGAVRLAYHWLKQLDNSVQQEGSKTPPAPEARQCVRALPQSTRSRQHSRGTMVVFDGIRTPLPHDLKPGEQAALSATIQGPPQTGEFILRVTMVEEGVAWFEQWGGQPLDLPVTVMAQ